MSGYAIANPTYVMAQSWHKLVNEIIRDLTNVLKNMVVMGGLEPPTPAL